MVKTPATKNISKGSRFKLYEGRHEKDKHVRLTNDMLLDKKFLSLKSGAKVLYFYLKLWACGQEQVEYSISMSSKYMSAPTFEKAKKELIAKVFIEQPNFFTARDKRETAVYKFSDKWQRD